LDFQENSETGTKIVTGIVKKNTRRVKRGIVATTTRTTTTTTTM
jgi:hypothetical protein